MLCVILPPEFIQQDLKFTVNVNKVNSVNKALYNKFLESEELNGIQKTVLKIKGQFVLSHHIKCRKLFEYLPNSLGYTFQ